MSFSFYKVDSVYCDYLREEDPCVPYTMDKKASRPFVGIVFEVNGVSYYAPLTSPKPKHLKMKNQMDFLKINNGVWGAINFNNMIPVPLFCLTKVDMKITQEDTKDEKDYKNLLTNQLSWCNANKESVLKKAEKLYELVANERAPESIRKRCCNFTLDEKRCQIYEQPVRVAKKRLVR